VKETAMAKTKNIETTEKKEAAEEKGSGMFLWIFIGINVLFAILFLVKFFWS
jgi:hypothetical protein